MNTENPNKENLQEVLVMPQQEAPSGVESPFAVPIPIQKTHPDAVLPQYGSAWASGFDFVAVEEVLIQPHETALVPTGLRMAIPPGLEIQVRPRSGLSLKTSLRIANAPGTLDGDYRGDVGIVVHNTGHIAIQISKGMRIAQGILAPVFWAQWQEVESLEETERGERGFGSTDTQVETNDQRTN